jgi:hypothetical protein
VRRQGVLVRRFHENVEIAALHFVYTTLPKDVAQWAVGLSQRMQTTPAGPDLLSPPERREWSPNLVHKLLAIICDPSQVILIQAGKSFAAGTPPRDSVADWFGTKFATRKLTDSQIDRWTFTPVRVPLVRFLWSASSCPLLVRRSSRSFFFSSPFLESVSP